ncbi:MAG: hypothetical protein U0230_13045 [Polyangiales bacterium]
MVRIHRQGWPVVVTEVSGDPGAEDVEVAIREYERIFEDGVRFVSLVDITGVNAIPSAQVRNAYADWRAAHYADLEEHVAAVAFVVGNHPLLLGTLTALSWMASHPSPTGHFRSHDEAMAFLAPYAKALVGHAESTRR